MNVRFAYDLPTKIYDVGKTRGCKKQPWDKASVHESGQMPFFLTNTVENSENWGT